MEVKLVNPKPFSGSQSVLQTSNSPRLLCGSTSSSLPIVERQNYSSRISSCRVICSRRLLPPATDSSIAEKPTTSIGGGGAFQGYLNWINGTTNSTSLGLFSWGSRVLDSSDDEYDGVLVNPDRLPSDPQTFASMLLTSLSHWRTKGKKGVWLKLPVEYSQLVPVAIKEGFEYHHAERGYVMLIYWIPEGPCLLPANASHQVGVGGFVINDYNEVLVVKEKYCTPGVDGYWKIPTGFILESEEIYSGAVREVKEETGVETEFLEVIAFRHAQNMAFQKSDLFFVCMLKPLSTDIKVDDHEIQAAKWMPLGEFVKQSPVQEDHMFKKVVDIFMARLGQKYCGLFAHQLPSKFDGHRSSTLYYNIMKDPDSTYCRPS